jgi:predicted RNA-binding Zn ribbon-like protein
VSRDHTSPGNRTKQSAGLGRSHHFPRLLGGRLCLDFVNTIEAPRRASPVDFIRSYDDLVRWSWHARSIDLEEADDLIGLAASQSQVAGQVLARALSLRAAVDGLGRALARGMTPADADVILVQSDFVEGLQNARLTLIDQRFEWTWRAAAHDLRKPLWLIARSAVDLIQDGRLDRLKECPGADDCGWLFYDTSRTGGRRWCSMEGCGSRVKMRRHYARSKGRISDD